jgi:hypothetical protein
MFAAGFLQLAACSSGAGNDAAPPPLPPNATLIDTLNDLGVNTDDSPRLDNRGLAYPDSYAPLGTIVALRKVVDSGASGGFRLENGRPQELLIGGFRLDGRQGVLSVIDDLPSGEKDGGLTVSPTLFHKTNDAAPWVVERNTGGNSASGPRVVQGTRRDATAGDFSGTGFHDTAVAYYVEYTNGGRELRLLTTNAKGPSPQELDVAIPVDPAIFPINDVRVASGDFDGDQKDEIAIVVSRVPEAGLAATPVRLYIVDDASTGFALARQFDPGIDTGLASPLITLVVTDARLDHDINSELVVVINAEKDTAPKAYATRYIALKNQAAGITVLSGGPVVAQIDGQNHAAVVADVAAGDRDGDGVDELFFAGLEEIIGNCQSQDLNGLKHVLLALGNSHNNFAQVGASADAIRPPDCDDANPTTLRFTHVNALDFDGNGDLDIQVNNLVFDDIPRASWNATPLAELPGGVIVSSNDAQPWYDRSNSAMAVSDQTGDGVADILTLLIDRTDPVVNVWSCEPDETTGRCRVVHATSVGLSPQDFDTSPVNPILVPVDVDNDDVVLLRYQNEHVLDFVEPLVLAVLAAPPCEEGIGQNVDACETTWGSAASAELERTLSLKASGSVSAGAGVAGAGGSFTTKRKMSLSASVVTSESYELTRSLSFSTGPREDSVIFTTMPLDRYTYKAIVSSDPAELGANYLVNLPRDVIMMIAERGYYNASVQPDALKIADEVFSHVPGRISTYPSEANKDAILTRERSLLEQVRSLSLIDPVVALRGLEVGPISVGQGAGTTELGLEYVESLGAGNALEFGYEYESEVAYGPLIGFTIGISGERTLSVSHGDSTTYAGVVGSIDAAHFAENRYEFGLFTYLQSLCRQRADSEGEMEEVCQEIEVVNYWVESDR